MDFKIEVDEEKCIACGRCDHFCPKAGYLWKIKDHAIWTGKINDNKRYCHLCTNCVFMCRQRALSLVKYEVNEKIKYSNTYSCVRRSK